MHFQPGQGLLLTRSGERTEPQETAIAQLRALHPDIGGAITLLDRFAALICGHGDAGQEDRLTRWLADAAGSGLPELTAFAVKLRQDLTAVRAGLDAPVEPGADRGADPQAEAAPAADVRAWQLRPRLQAGAPRSVDAPKRRESRANGVSPDTRHSGITRQPPMRGGGQRRPSPPNMYPSTAPAQPRRAVRGSIDRQTAFQRVLSG